MMKVIELTQHGPPHKAFIANERPIPEPDAEEVLIKAECFGLNFADVLARKGLYREAPNPPCVLGYEVVGEIKEVGEDVENLKEGQRVVGFTRFGGYAQYVATDYRGVTPLPDSIEAAPATALATQYCTAYYSAYEMVNLHEGDNVLITAAAGGVGTGLVQLAKRKGCTIFGMAGSPEKLEYLEQQGVDYPINYRKENFKQAIEDRGERMQVVFDSVGGKVFRHAKKVIGAGGRIVTFGAAGRISQRGGWLANLKLVWDFGFLHPLMLLMKSKGVIGVNMLRIADYNPEMIQHCLEQVVSLAEKGELAPHVSNIYTVDQVDQAHAELENRQSIGKVVVRWPTQEEEIKGSPMISYLT